MKPRILIVEDNADLRRLYAIGLNQRGYEVKLAANGAEAVDRTLAEQPDVIILDLQMPVMDGWEFIERINPRNGSVETRPPLPVLVVSGHAPPEGREIPPCIRGWLLKPATIEEVAEQLAQIAGIAATG